MRKNRRIQDILLEKQEAEERKDERQSMTAFWMALPLAIVQLLII